MGMKQAGAMGAARPPQRSHQALAADANLKRLKMGGGQGPMAGAGMGARMPMQMGAPRAAMPRQASASLPHLWTQADDDLLCAMVVEYGPNWTLIADTLSASSNLQARFGTPPALDASAARAAQQPACWQL